MKLENLKVLVSGKFDKQWLLQETMSTVVPQTRLRITCNQIMVAPYKLL